MCGILGMINLATTDAKKSEFVYDFLTKFQRLQHRGQDACGIAYSDGGRIRVDKGLGLITQVFDKQVIDEVRAKEPVAIIGHTRYPTAGKNTPTNTQPHFVDTNQGRLALVSNGDIPRYQEYRTWLENQGVEFLSSNDAELLLRAIIYYSRGQTKNLQLAIKQTMKKIEGAYSAILMAKDTFYVFRDRHEVRPLTIVKKNSYLIIASETCVVNDFLALPPENVVSLPGDSLAVVSLAGEIKIFLPDDKTMAPNNASETEVGLETSRTVVKKKCHCVFEMIYLARPDSYVFNCPGQAFTFRKCLGQEWVKEVAAIYGPDFLLENFGFVSAIPASGEPFAEGVGEASALKYRCTIIRNFFIPRTFIAEGQADKKVLVGLKHNVLADPFRQDHRGLWCDDSIVRGTTTKGLLQAIKNAGAKKIGLAISCPPLVSGCQLGINLPKLEELIAQSLTVEEVRNFLKIDFLHYLSLAGLKKALEQVGFQSDDFCFGCFTGNYQPFKVNFK